MEIKLRLLGSLAVDSKVKCNGFAFDIYLSTSLASSLIFQSYDNSEIDSFKLVWK